MDAVVGAQGDGAEEDAGPLSSPPRSAEPAPAPALGAHLACDVSDDLAQGVPNALAVMDVPVGAQGDGAGALSSPLISAAPALGAHLACDVNGGVAGRAIRDLCDEVVERLIAGGRLEASAFDMAFCDMLATHFARFPPSYHLYVKTVKAEDVIIHMKLLEEAKDPERRPGPASHVQFLRAEEPILDMRTNRYDAEDANFTRFGSPGSACSNIHEIIFGSVHNPNLLSQLSAILYDIGLNVKHVHLFATNDGFCVSAFMVEGWHSKNIIGLIEELKAYISTNEKLRKSISTNQELKTPTPASSSNSSNYATARESIRLARYSKMRKRSEKLKQQRMMESFRAILSDSIAFLFPAMLAIFTSSFEFHDSEKPFLILVFSMGGLLILLNLVLSHGVEDGAGRTAVVSFLTLLTVIYVFGVFEYFLYKFFPAGDFQVTALHCIGAHFLFGAIMLRWLWGYSFKISR